MFENILSNFKSKSKSKVSDSSVASKISESFSNIRYNIMDKTTSLSSYFLNNQQANDTQKSSISTPSFKNHNKVNKADSSFRHSNRSEYIQFNPIADYDEEENIVDRFTRSVTIDEDGQSLNRKYSFRRRNDREEIRRRLATGDSDEFYGGDRPGRKPSLQARLQSGMNLQICFMNDQMSDTESPSSDSEAPTKVNSPMKQKQPSPLSKAPELKKLSPTANGPLNGGAAPAGEMSEVDVLVCVARLQTEARTALAQAADLAHLTMQVERQRRSASPITEMLRNTLHKVGVLFPEDRRRVSRQMLTDMNIAQLQVIANDLHAQIETLNESLVKFLMERDELHMSQDSMLVDIEDLTRYLGAKENTFKEDISFNNNLHESKLPANRSARLVRK